MASRARPLPKPSDSVYLVDEVRSELIDLGVRLKDVQASGREKLIRLIGYERDRAKDQLDQFMCQATLDGDDTTAEAVEEAQEAASEQEREAE